MSLELIGKMQVRQGHPFVQWQGNTHWKEFQKWEVRGNFYEVVRCWEIIFVGLKFY